MNDSTRAVFDLMFYYDGACPKTFADHKIYRYSARIYDLRKMGYQIGSRRCRSPIHSHTKRINEYYVVDRSVQLEAMFDEVEVV